MIRIEVELKKMTVQVDTIIVRMKYYIMLISIN